MSTSCDLPGMNVPKSRFPAPDTDLPSPASGGEQRLVLGGGCFWCVEAVYLAINGVSRVVSGYAGGAAKTANYDSVCSGQTGHAEVIELHYNPTAVSFGELLKVFFSVAHDPTQLNRQGNDRGTVYRSASYYSDDAQRDEALNTIADVDASGLWPGKVVTEVEPAGDFWEAEPEHQDYLVHRPNGYTCHFIRPNWVLPRRQAAE